MEVFNHKDNNGGEQVLATLCVSCKMSVECCSNSSTDYTCQLLGKEYIFPQNSLQHLKLYDGNSALMKFVIKYFRKKNPRKLVFPKIVEFGVGFLFLLFGCFVFVVCFFVW